MISNIFSILFGYWLKETIRAEGRLRFCTKGRLVFDITRKSGPDFCIESFYLEGENGIEHTIKIPVNPYGEKYAKIGENFFKNKNTSRAKYFLVDKLHPIPKVFLNNMKNEEYFLKNQRIIAITDTGKKININVDPSFWDKFHNKQGESLNER